MYCTCGACCEVMWCILWDMRLCDVWVGSQLDEGFNKAPQPTDCHAIAAVTDMVLLAMRESIQSKQCSPVKILPNIHSIIRLGFTTICAAASLYANLCMAMVWYVKQTYVYIYMYMVYMYMSGTCNQNQHGRPIHAKAMCDSWDPTLSHCVMQTYTYAHKCVYIRHIYIHREG